MPSNLHSLTFQENLADEVIHAESCETLVITSLSYLRNLRSDQASHSALFFEFTSVFLRLGHFRQT